MRILHYLLGLPPVRGGGLVKYAVDLAEEQSKEDEVFLLIPGPISKKVEMRKRVSIKREGCWKNIPQYRIHNPLPIPMGNGILNIPEFTIACNGDEYMRFLEEIAPDVIHVHTLMGLHKEFLLKAKALGIPVVYTTHDYFGICPIANLLYKNSVCNHPGIHCGECSRYAFSEKRLLLEQSTAYRMYRNSNSLIRMLRGDSLKRFMGSLRSQSPEKAAEEAQKTGLSEQQLLPTEEEYSILLKYYREMFSLVTYFHFNSKISRQIYEQYLGNLTGEVIYISNKSVIDKRTLHESQGKLKIGFLGGDIAFKGLHRLQKILNELYCEGKEQIELQIYGSLERKVYPFCQYYDAYTEQERDKVFARIDILAVPSSWMETFGLVVLEALSYGVPVMVTDKVGAKGLLEENKEPMGLVLPDNDRAWKDCFEDLYEHREKIRVYSGNICNSLIELKYVAHVKRMKELYQVCI